MAEGEPQGNEDVSDLMAFMDDPGMVAIMRRAVADEQWYRDLPTTADRTESDMAVGRTWMLFSTGMINIDRAGTGFYQKEDGTRGMKNPDGTRMECRF